MIRQLSSYPAYLETMKKYKYKAEAYLKLIQMKLNEVIRKLGEVQARKNELLNQRTWLLTEKRNCFLKIAEFGKSDLSIYKATDTTQFISLIEKQIVDLESHIEEVDQMIEQRRKAVQDIQIEMKRIETHKENDFNAYKKRQAKALQKKIDNINATRQRRSHAKPI